MSPSPNDVAAQHHDKQLETLTAQIAELEQERDHWREHARTWEKRAKAATSEHEEQIAALEHDRDERERHWQRRLLAERYGVSQQDAEQFLTRDTPEENERIAARLGTRKPLSAPHWTR